MKHLLIILALAGVACGKKVINPVTQEINYIIVTPCDSCPKCGTLADTLEVQSVTTVRVDTVWNTITRCSVDSFEMTPTDIIYEIYPARRQLACPFGHPDFSCAVQFPVSKRLERHEARIIKSVLFHCPKCLYEWNKKITTPAK